MLMQTATPRSDHVTTAAGASLEELWLFGLPRAMRQGQYAQWRSLLSSGNDAISRTGDRAPLAGALIDAAGFFLTSLRHNISTNAATTFDIEWNGEEMD